MAERELRNPEAVQRMLADMATALERNLAQRGAGDPALIGIHTGGVWVAQALAERLGIDTPLGTLDISFYRDDFTRIGLNPQVRPSNLPFAVDNRHIVLVDDVLHTGRTIRAALNEIFDYGRPASVLLAVLIERNGRELPIEPAVCGERLELPPRAHVKLTGQQAPRILLNEIA